MNVAIYVPDLPEYGPIVNAAEASGLLNIVPPKAGYWQLQSPGSIRLTRKQLGLRTALWFSMLTGGYCGRVIEYTKDNVVIEQGN